MEKYQDLITFDWNLLFSALTFLALLLIAYKFFFKKVHDFMEARSQAVQDQLDNAKTAQEEADARLAQYENIVSDAEEKGREIIKEARLDANARAEKIVLDAHDEAGKIISKANKDIEIEKQQATQAMKDQIAELAIEAAGQIIGEELSKSGHDAIIDDVIAKAGEK
ncbi:MAG: F0F1 ATP synthase subunit B [Clostridia bacterium]|nr:F0F1 ATP synthase subunit B [Clostridia bacterium]